jgi:hypothetical protein
MSAKATANGWTSVGHKVGYFEMYVPGGAIAPDVHLDHCTLCRREPHAAHNSSSEARPVLMCTNCKRPTLHTKADAHWACACGQTRRWGSLVVREATGGVS